jgi:hypothetical protein
MDDPTSTELLLVACELALHVDCRPQRRDGTDAAVYASSGATLARRVQAGPVVSATCNETPMEPGRGRAPFCWEVTLPAGAARRTNYSVWLRESPDQLRTLWLARKQARELRAKLPHDQRKKKPWGPL